MVRYLGMPDGASILVPLTKASNRKRAGVLANLTRQLLLADMAANWGIY